MSQPHQDESQRGVIAALVAYLLWGLFPIYFAALAPANAVEILAHRIVWTLVTCAVVLAWRRDGAWIRRLLGDRRMAARVTVAALVIAVNWGVYVWSVRIGRTTDAALGYFLNPLVTVALGVLVLRERLRPLQWIAVGIGLVAALYLTLAAGGLPWIALVLAVTFATYGLLKKQVGGAFGPWQALAGETAVLAPLALVALAVMGAHAQTTFTGHGSLHTVLLLAAGIITAVPLLLFAAAAQRIPLVLVGLIQFITPIMQLIVGVLLQHERMSSSHWVGFGIVWLALVALSVDSVLAFRRRRVILAQGGQVALAAPASGLSAVPGIGERSDEGQQPQDDGDDEIGLADVGQVGEPRQ